jgi:hypothetical protein
MGLDDEFYDRAIQHMKEQEARQWAEDHPSEPIDTSNPLEVLVWLAFWVGGGILAVYALFATIFGG